VTGFTQGLLMATKRPGLTKRRAWTKQDVRELKEHSRSKSPMKKIARAMNRTIGALRQKGAQPRFVTRPSPVIDLAPANAKERVIYSLETGLNLLAQLCD
jgi:hypothetical protein